MFKHKYDHEFDDELPAIDVSSSIRNSHVEMPSARELAARRARELSVERALRAAPDDSLLTALNSLQVATQPEGKHSRPVAPSLSAAFLTAITPEEDTKKLHSKIIDVMNVNNSLIRDQVVYEICTCLCSSPLPEALVQWTALTLWVLAIGEGGICTKRALQEILQRYKGHIDLESLAETMCTLVTQIKPELSLWRKVISAVRGSDVILYDAVLRRAVSWAFDNEHIKHGVGPVTEEELLSAVEARPSGGSGSGGGSGSSGSGGASGSSGSGGARGSSGGAGGLAALALSGRALLAARERERERERGMKDTVGAASWRGEVQEVRARLLGSLETRAADRSHAAHPHECAVSARRLRMLFQ